MSAVVISKIYLCGPRFEESMAHVYTECSDNVNVGSRPKGEANPGTLTIWHTDPERDLCAFGVCRSKKFANTG